MITNSFDLNEEQFYQLPLNERKLHLLSKIVTEGGLDNKLKSMRAKISEYKELVSILELDSQITELIQTIQKKKFSNGFYFDVDDYRFLSSDGKTILKEIKSFFSDTLVWNITKSQFELIYSSTSSFLEERYLIISSFELDKTEFCELLEFLVGDISLDNCYQKFDGSILKHIKKRLITGYKDKDFNCQYLNYTVQTPEECLVELTNQIETDFKRYSNIDFDLFVNKQTPIPMVKVVIPILKERFETDKSTIPFVFYCSHETIELFCDPGKMNYKERFDLVIEVLQKNLQTEGFDKVKCEKFFKLLFISPKDIFNYLLDDKKLQEYLKWVVKRDVNILNNKTQPPHPETISDKEASDFDKLLILMNLFNIKLQDLSIFKRISSDVFNDFSEKITISPVLFSGVEDSRMKRYSIFGSIQLLAGLFSNIMIDFDIYFTERNPTSIKKFFNDTLLKTYWDFTKDVKWIQDTKKESGIINLNFNIKHSFESKKEIEELEHTLSKFDKVTNLSLPVTVTVSYKPQVVMKAKSECQKFDKISDYFNGYHYKNTATINTIFCG